MKEKLNKKQISLSALFILIICIWIISGLVTWFVFKDWNKSGTFGDTFGAINSLFSGLAFCGVIYTIYLQKTELTLQRKELEYTRVELKRTASAQEVSANLMTEQIRINNIPYLQYSSSKKDNINFLTIQNESENPAFDVDIWIFTTQDDFTFPLKDFIKKWISEDHLKYIKIDKLVDDVIWAIAERGIYHVFPKKKLIKIPINYPVDNDSVSMFIQFRDCLNNNYSQHIHFGKKRDSTIPYYDSSYEPAVPTLMKRVDLSDSRLTESELPKIAEGLVELLKSSIYVSRLKDRKYVGVENVWEFENIN